jgi:hypothetical protein
VRFTVSKLSGTNGIGFEAPTLEEALRLAVDLMDGKGSLERVQIFDAEQDRYYDETQILRLLREQ